MIKEQLNLDDQSDGRIEERSLKEESKKSHLSEG